MPSKTCCSTRRCDAHAQSSSSQEVKEFVIIGNGPSGISLSYLLSGNWPYYRGGCQDEMLHARLTSQPQLSLLEQDLEFLSDGLEGRSNNPVSLLFDALQRPEADLGLDLPSLLEWRHLPDKRIDHVVLGRGGPGGVWRTLDGGLLTVSLGAWMQLPNLTMQSWEASHLANTQGEDSLISKRTSISSVAQYYTDYVEVMGLAENFRNYTVVTKVRQLSRGSSRGGQAAEQTAEQITEQAVKQTAEQAAKQSAEQTADPSAVPVVGHLCCRRRSCPPVRCTPCGCCSCRARSCCEPVVCSALPTTGPTGSAGGQRGSSSPPTADSVEGGSEEDLFLLEDCELSSACSSLTLSSASPDRDHNCPRLACNAGRSYCGDVTSKTTGERTTLRPEEPQESSRDHLASSDSGFNSLSRALNILTSSFDREEVCPSWDPILNPSLCSFAHRLYETFRYWDEEEEEKGERGQSCRTRLSPSPRSSGYCRQTSLPRVEDTLFEVTGYEIRQTGAGEQITENFSYLTKNVVLATGHDKPNRLGIEGEGLPFVLHSLKELEQAVDRGSITTNSDPVMIIGAGLSAADAILNAQGHGIPVVHVFRRAVDDPQLIFNKLPGALYPEYHRVHQMMAEGSMAATKVVHGQPVEKEHPGYRAFAQTAVVEICKGRRVRLAGPETNEEIQVSSVVVLVGAAPDLEFLETDTQLGQVPGNPIDKNNPIDIDVYSHQSVHVPGLFAMGPLTGDNFVRFLQGGALAIAAYAQKRRSKTPC